MFLPQQVDLRGPDMRLAQPAGRSSLSLVHGKCVHYCEGLVHAHVAL